MVAILLAIIGTTIKSGSKCRRCTVKSISEEISPEEADYAVEGIRGTQATLQGAAQALEALNSGEAGFGFDGMTLISVLKRYLLRIYFMNIWTV